MTLCSYPQTNSRSTKRSNIQRMNRIGAICSLYARSRTQDKESTGSKRSLGAVEMQFISLCWIARAVVQSCASMFVRLRASILRKMMQAFLANLGNEFARIEKKTDRHLKKIRKNQLSGPQTDLRISSLLPCPSLPKLLEPRSRHYVRMNKP